MALPSPTGGIGEQYPEICDSVTGDSCDSGEHVTVGTVGNLPKSVTV